MTPLMQKRSMKSLSLVVAVCFLSFQIAAFMPRTARADAGDELKQIEYKYYFRGDYQKAITELRALLERGELSDTQTVEAREYLAASLILSGLSEEGKTEFMKLLKMNESYGGPDPSVFKAVIVTTFNEAKSEYASAMIRTVPDVDTADAGPQTQSPEAGEGKPIYKKWWFYATMGAVLLAIAAAAGSGGDGGGTPNDGNTGTVTIGIGVR